VSIARDVDLARVDSWARTIDDGRRPTTDGEGWIGFERAMRGNDGCDDRESRGEGCTRVGGRVEEKR